jgi:molecular chaperone HtpG
VIRLLHNFPTRELVPVWFLEIYILNSNSWRKIDGHVPRSYDNTNVYMNSVCHWLSKIEKRLQLVSFNFNKESVITTLIPLVLLNGSIAYINYIGKSTFHISILGELGIKESWTKLFIVGPLPCLDYPIGAGKKGNILFRKRDGELAWFDLSNEMIEEIGVITRHSYGKIVLHKESILPIGGIKN